MKTIPQPTKEAVQNARTNKTKISGRTQRKRTAIQKGAKITLNRSW